MQRLTLTFSHPITPAPLDPTNWAVRFLNLDRPILAATVNLARQVEINTVGAIPDPGPDRVTFNPPPFDVVSDTLNPFPAAAFTDFPIHV